MIKSLVLVLVLFSVCAAGAASGFQVFEEAPATIPIGSSSTTVMLNPSFTNMQQTIVFMTYMADAADPQPVDITVSVRLVDARTVVLQRVGIAGNVHAVITAIQDPRFNVTHGSIIMDLSSPVDVDVGMELDPVRRLLFFSSYHEGTGYDNDDAGVCCFIQPLDNRTVRSIQLPVGTMPRIEYQAISANFSTGGLLGTLQVSGLLDTLDLSMTITLPFPVSVANTVLLLNLEAVSTATFRTLKESLFVSASLTDPTTITVSRVGVGASDSFRARVQVVGVDPANGFVHNAERTVAASELVIFEEVAAAVGHDCVALTRGLRSLAGTGSPGESVLNPTSMFWRGQRVNSTYFRYERGTAGNGVSVLPIQVFCYKGVNTIAPSLAPTAVPSSASPSAAPTSVAPSTTSPTTSGPTLLPTAAPTTAAPSPAPGMPTLVPTTSVPTDAPSLAPTALATTTIASPTTGASTTSGLVRTTAPSTAATTGSPTAVATFAPVISQATVTVIMGDIQGSGATQISSPVQVTGSVTLLPTSALTLDEVGNGAPLIVEGNLQLGGSLDIVVSGVGTFLIANASSITSSFDTITASGVSGSFPDCAVPVATAIPTANTLSVAVSLDESGCFPTALVAGSIAGGVALIAAVVITILCLVKKKEKDAIEMQFQRAAL